MLTRILAVALVAAAALALEAAFLHALVAAPLASAIGALEGAPGAPTFEERITVVAERPAPKPKPAS
jgi:ABC-type cobalamin transport system permease subunit